MRFTSSRPWAAGRFDAHCFFAFSSLISYQPGAGHWWLAVCCEPLARLGELRFTGLREAAIGAASASVKLSPVRRQSQAPTVRPQRQPAALEARGLRYSPGFKRRTSGVPASGLFIGMPDTQEGAFLPGSPNELHTHGKL